MKRLCFIEIATSFILLLLPLSVFAQPEQTKKESMPPVEQSLVREGAFAINLVSALDLGTPASEVEAENILGSAGIAPRNGWIADYPVTPDIISEVRASVSDAAEAGRITMGKDEAMEAFGNVSAEMNLAIKPYAVGETYKGEPPSSEEYANPSVVNNYYYDYGPPMVTYYPPPPDYYYLYSWVPFPFWWFDFFFPGFFILIDFHKVVVVNGTVVVITNHFVDPVTTQVFRIDPVRRFSGRTFAGIGAPRRGMISTGIPRSPERVFNRQRTMPSGGRSITSPSSRGKTFAPSSRGTRTFEPSSRGTRTFEPSSRGGRTLTPPSGGGKTIKPSPHGGKGIGIEPRK